MSWIARASRSELQSVRRLLEGVDGWLEDDEGAVLYRLARACRGRGAIVEIGSWMGRSTIWLASGARAAGCDPIYAVDPHVGAAEHRNQLDGGSSLQALLENVRHAGLEHHVEPVVSTSVEAGRAFSDPVELVFIDGNHEYEAALTDFQTWFPKVIRGGVMAFHDASPNVPESDGARRVVRQHVELSGDFYPIRSVHRLLYARKLGPSWRGRRALVVALLSSQRTLATLRSRLYHRLS